MLDKIDSWVLDAETDAKVEILLYKDVKNLKELKEKILDGSMKCCIIKASLIIDPFQVVVAANKALLSFKRNSATTRSVYSEILFNLSISKNITQSLTTFGLDEQESNLIVVIIHQSGIKFDQDEVTNLINGKQCPLEELKSMSDIKLIEKIYKVKMCKEYNLTDVIVSKICTKDFLSN